MSPGTLSSFWKCSLHLATTLLLSEEVSIPYMLISSEQVPSSGYRHFLHVFPSAAFCTSTAFLFHESDIIARVCFCSSLQAYLYTAVVDRCCIWQVPLLLMLYVFMSVSSFSVEQSPDIPVCNCHWLSSSSSS